MTSDNRLSARDRLRRILIDLASVPGPSGFEGPIREKIHKLWSPWADHLAVSGLGNLAARLDGTGPSPRPSLAMVAHMDTIGFVVRRVDAGFVWVSGLGRPDPRVLLGQSVTVLGRQAIEGIMVRPPDSCLTEDQRAGTVGIEQLLVDLGRDAADVAQLVREGDAVVFDQPVQALADDLIIGPGLDNRASLASLTETLAMLHQQRPAWDILAVATTREEQSLAGGATSGFDLAPQLAVAVDTTYGRGPMDDDDGTFPIGAGLTNGLGPSLHPAVHTLLAEAAHRAQIPLVNEILPGFTFTDADALQVAGAGIPTGLLSLPTRNMHTCVEMVHLDDLLWTCELLANLAGQLDDSTLTTVKAAFNDA